MRPIVGLRHGDIEDDASSIKRRSMLSLAGSLLVGLPKLIAAWVILAIPPRPLSRLRPLGPRRG